MGSVSRAYRSSRPGDTVGAIETHGTGDRCVLRTGAPPVEGKANRRVVELLADHSDCRVEQVTIVAEHTSPIQHVDVSVAGTG